MNLVNTAPATVRGDPVTRRVAPLRYLVTVVCAGSAGVHAALVLEHLHESTPLGLAFAGATAALALIAIAARKPRNDAWAPAVAALVLLMTAAAYVLSRTSGIPVLLADPEEVDLLGVITSSAEAVAAAAALLLLDRRDLS